MKTKSLIVTALLMAMSFVVSAQTPQPQPNFPVFIRGNMDIKYNSKAVVETAKDVYTLDFNVCNSARFQGTITDTPLIMSGLINKVVSSPRSLYYDISCDILDPKKNGQMVGKNVSHLVGKVPIDLSGTYNYNAGNLEFSVLDKRAGSDSKFGGLAAGKPLNRPDNWLDKAKLKTVYITRNIGGTIHKVALTKYDKMEFQPLTFAAGPLGIYQTATANGEMYYDYDKYEWFFKDIKVDYSTISTNGQNVPQSDRLTGTIRWIPDAHRAQNGLGHYEFDIRVNEPIATEFTSTAPITDESSFSEVDNSVPSLTGTMAYKDSLDPKTVNVANDPLGNNATTLSSAITVDLNGNGINKYQAMVLFKMVILASVVPMNSD